MRRDEQTATDADGRYLADTNGLVGQPSADTEKLSDDLDVEHMFSNVGERVPDHRSLGRMPWLWKRDDASAQTFGSTVERVGEDQSELVGSHLPSVAGGR